MNLELGTLSAPIDQVSTLLPLYNQIQYNTILVKLAIYHTTPRRQNKNSFF